MIKLFTNPSPEQIGNNVESFLEILGETTCIVMDGNDNNRSRVFVTLLHGNEPSGVMSLFRWIKERKRPSVKIICIIASIKTALQPPLFHYRTLPGIKDLNRCFQSPFVGNQGKLANDILNIIHQHKPEAVIDMHNTSGSGPAFGVATHQDLNHEELTALFSDKLVITHLRLGALMDISEKFYPTITIEAGGRLDQKAHDTAWQGMVRFFTDEHIVNNSLNPKKVDSFIEPVRIELVKGTSLSYAKTPNIEFDVTLADDLDQLNFDKIDSSTPLGWVNRGELDNFQVQDYKHQTSPSDWLRIQNGRLYPADKVIFFMITTNPVIGIDDCLFYGVKI
ncbi:MAG: succinylglutamate desuccinylase [Cellvibrionaceae bacterium]